MGRVQFVEQAVQGWRRRYPNRDLTSLGVVQLLIWCGRLSEELLDAAARESGLRKRGDYEVMALLRRSEPQMLSPVEVSDALLTSPSGMTGKLDRLEAQGLVQRLPDPDDRRAIKLGLTESGRIAIDHAFEMSVDLYDAMIPSVFDSVEMLEQNLKALLEHLQGIVQP